MPFPAKKWTDEQGSAILLAHFEDGHPVREITRKAHAGTLYGLPAFPIPNATVAQRLSLERTRRRQAQAGPDDPPARIDAYARRLLNLAGKALMTCENRPGKPNLDEAAQIAKLLKEVQGLTRPGKAQEVKPAKTRPESPFTRLDPPSSKPSVPNPEVDAKPDQPTTHAETVRFDPPSGLRRMAHEPR